MGFAFSKPSGIVAGPVITREQLLKSTENNRDFTNKLFQLMISKLTPEDFLKLGNPSTCNSYIFMMAESIKNIFKDLRIRPSRKGDSGVVVFQKIDALKKSGNESKELCLIIAYFYIRIFQLFGALAMSILDDPSAGQVLGMIRYGPAQPGKRIIPGTRGPYPLYGGDPDESEFTGSAERPFLPLAHVFEDVNYDDSGRRVFSLKNVDPYIVELVPTRVKPSQRNIPQNLRILLSDTIVLYGNMRLNKSNLRSRDPVYVLTLDTFSYLNNDITSQELDSINSELKRVKIEPITILSIDNGQTWRTVNGTPFANKIKNTIESLKNAIKNAYTRRGPDQRVSRYDDPRIYGRRQPMDAITAQRYALDRVQNPSLYREPRARGQVDQRGLFGVRDGVGKTDIAVPKALQNEYILRTLKSLTGQKTVGFCTARAFQLLDASTMFQSKPQQGISGVCKTVFTDLPDSVPQAGKPISTVPGIRVLDQLHRVPGAGKEPWKIANPADYANFLKEITGLFGSQQTGPLSGIDSILAKNPNCAGLAANKYLQLQDPEKIKIVMSHVNRLFGRQLAHTNRVIEFFRKRLFLIIQPPGAMGPQIDIHPKLLQGGIDELEKVSAEVRGLLVQYYKDCEMLYQEGVTTVFQAKYQPVS